jgi:hypothetical protein
MSVLSSMIIALRALKRVPQTQDRSLFLFMATYKTSLVEAVQAELGVDVRSKEINFVGGTTLPGARSVDSTGQNLRS